MGGWDSSSSIPLLIAVPFLLNLRSFLVELKPTQSDRNGLALKTETRVRIRRNSKFKALQLVAKRRANFDDKINFDIEYEHR